MPITIKELDSSTRQEKITLILGKNVLLKIIENPEAQSLLEDNAVKAFVSIPGLCNEDARSLIQGILKEESLVGAPSFIRTLKDRYEDGTLESTMKVADSLKDFTDVMNSSRMSKILEDEIGESLQRAMKKLSKEDMESLRSEMMRNLVGTIDEKSVESSNEKLLSLGTELKKRMGSEILAPASLLLCPKCKALISTTDFVGETKCYVCQTDVSHKNVKRISIYRMNDKVKKVWEKNLWFEAYFAGLLRRLRCETWTSVHIMGASGILHEVDVLAIRDETVIACECKTGKVSRNDVFNFCTKVSDLKAHISILALIHGFPEPETRRFVKKNPAIIGLENMGKREEAEILKELDRRLSMKG
jgi:hypothetical protein